MDFVFSVVCHSTVVRQCNGILIWCKIFACFEDMQHVTSMITGNFEDENRVARGGSMDGCGGIK